MPTEDTVAADRRRDTRRVPLLTLGVLLVTALITGLQGAVPGLLFTLQRNPQTYVQGQWWRLFTSLLVHDQGWRQITFNFTSIAMVGAWSERLFGRRRWLLFYLAGGLIGQIAGYSWQPEGAGASVAGAGLLGAVLVWLLIRGKGLPLQVRVWGVLGLLGAVALTASHDIHGPSLLAGASMAAVMLRRAPGTLQLDEHKNTGN